jgi:protein-S-isoprenylcysteine O-methyltransferase Ste14
MQKLRKKFNWEEVQMMTRKQRKRALRAIIMVFVGSFTLISGVFFAFADSGMGNAGQMQAGSPDSWRIVAIFLAAALLAVLAALFFVWKHRRGEIAEAKAIAAAKRNCVSSR